MLNDPLANALSKIMNAEKVGKSICLIKPISSVIKKMLTLMKEAQYVGEFKEVDDGKGGFIKLNLLGKINRCGAVKPRFAVKKDQYEKFEQRYLLAKDFGIIFVSTSKGIMPHAQAKKEGIGGKLLAYVY